MNIGLLAIGFSVIISPIALYGMLCNTQSKPQPQADYQSIYKALAPRDL